MMGSNNSLMMWCMVVVMLAAFCTKSRRRSPSISTIHIEDTLFILYALGLSSLLRIDSLKP